jgi:hypothetical protein
MSPDRFDVLERYAPVIDAPQPAFEDFLRRRDRKRRNQRIAAGAVGIAFFAAAVWVVTTGGSFDRGLTPAVPGPTPDAVDPVGLIGLPPQVPPSTPRHGELVLSFMFGHTMGDPGRFDVNVYADGRVIWQRHADRTSGADAYAVANSTGLIEQRLTPEGVERVRSEVLSTGLLDDDLHFSSTRGLFFGQISVRTGDGFSRVTWGNASPDDSALTLPSPEQAAALQRLDARLADLSSWLPESAWEDREMRPYVPSRYSLCYEAQRGVGLDRVLGSLPQQAEDVLRTWNRSHTAFTPPGLGAVSVDIWCSDVTTDEARELARILEDSAAAQRYGGPALQYAIEQRNPSATDVSFVFLPLLPHETDVPT